MTRFAFGIVDGAELAGSEDAVPSPIVDADCAEVMPPSEGTAFNAPALLVDFSACVAPIARR